MFHKVVWQHMQVVVRFLIWPHFFWPRSKEKWRKDGEDSHVNKQFAQMSKAFRICIIIDFVAVLFRLASNNQFKQSL